MNEWIQRANLVVFRQLIAGEEDEARRRELELVLQQEEARLESRVVERFAPSADALQK